MQSREYGGEDQREDDVELLLDGERPEMAQQRRPAQRLEVGLVLEDEVPVGHIGETGERIAAQRGDFGRQEDDGVQKRAGDEREERRKQSARAPAPEGEHVDAARAAAALGKQQRSDEVAADHEENIDAEEASPEQADISVVDEDGGHREGAQAIDRRNVGEETGTAGGDGVVRRSVGCGDVRAAGNIRLGYGAA